MSAEAFDTLVADALDEIPAELARLIDNCVILVEEFPPPDDPDLLGLYDGIPLTERGETYSGALPDRILIFRAPILAMCALCGRLGSGADAWRWVAPLPFELGACPHRWLQWLRLPVVSYALPALIAIG